MITIEQAVKDLHAKHSGVNDRPEMWQDIARMMEEMAKDAANTDWRGRALKAEAAIAEAHGFIQEALGQSAKSEAGRPILSSLFTSPSSTEPRTPEAPQQAPAAKTV